MKAKSENIIQRIESNGEIVMAVIGKRKSVMKYGVKKTAKYGCES
jgi:hypothetical protein